MFKRLNEEIRNIQRRDALKPAYLRVLFLYPSIQIRVLYKIATVLQKMHLTAISHLLLAFGRMITGIEINLGAKLGKRLFIDHGMGVVIGATSVIGDDVVMYQGVTLGGNKDIPGRRHPIIGNNVTIGAGAKVLGAITIGDNVQVGANAVVTKDTPSDTVVAGIPAKIIKSLYEYDDYVI